MSTTVRRSEVGTAHAIGSGGGKIGRVLELQKDPSFLHKRLALFDKLYSLQQEKNKELPKSPITIELPDGAKKEGLSNQTTPMDIAMQISKGLADKVVAAEVCYSVDAVNGGAEMFNPEEEDEVEGCESCGGGENWVVWDMTRPLEHSCKLRLLKFEDAAGKHVFWHSSAHILGQCLEMELGVQLTVGPALTSGFYYDAYMGDHSITQDVYELLEKHAERICKENQIFERLVMTKEEALEMFSDNPFKVQLITNKIPDAALTSAYRCGRFVDLCRGPHLPSTGKVRAFAVTKHSSAYWLAQSDLDSLQRTYAISFPEAKQLKEYNRLVEEAKKRDHRTLGSNLDLFFFDPSVSPGSCFWLPEGARLYNKLSDFMRNEYRIRGFAEVITPNIFSCDLWKTSGHYQNYKENMYLFEVEGKEWGLKPMNCPGHCCMFKHMNPSYKQLPIRLADFGVLHRNEMTGSLSGLTRVRRFQQDDAHIFCTAEQIKAEVLAALEFLFFVYGRFGFEYELQLSTMPKKALGSKEQWDVAEKALEEALNETGKKWTLNPGDGAFYGPKVDIRLWDALKRSHQCGTVQLDFQLPLRFNLQYRTQDEAIADESSTKRGAADAAHCENPTDSLSFKEGHIRPGCARPVMIHRAILGSIERMVAVLIEHTAGKFPFWLSPRQAIVLPISDKHNEYAQWVEKTLTNFGYDVGIDMSSNTINKKIREAQIHQWNYMLVVGEQESNSGTVTVRMREDPKHQQQLPVQQLLAKFEEENMPSSQQLKQFTPWRSDATNS
eukprot:GHVS01058521.1.p1 GENE.GHVS01058521.1~~GHVS01058521.1.p1  ORF type:complete len:841 (+),score=90.25 GHVS01058521.1:187-2523(+)